MKFSHSAALALLLAPVVHADYDATKWTSRRPIALDGKSATVQIVPDKILYRESKTALRDIRIVRDGVEVPYALETLHALSERREVPAAVRNRSVISGVGVQFTLDAGQPTRHNRVRIATSLHDFKQTVRIETSAGESHWAIARKDGSIFDVSRADQPASSLAVEYPESTQRFVRVTILGWRDPEAVIGAWLSRQEDRSETRSTIAEVEPSATQSSEFLVDLGFAGMPHDKVVFEIAQSAFSRSVEIDSGNKISDLRFIGQGTIWRSADGALLTVSFPEVWDRYLRCHVFNHDDRPLILRKILVQAVARSILFPASVAGKYWIYYGNTAAHQPVYDLAAVATSEAKLGPEEPNPSYREPDKPVSDRHPILLYALLGVAILVMGYVTVRFLLKVQA